MAVPGVRFLGMSASDYKKFKMPKAAEIKLTKEDITRAEQMKAYPWFKDAKWQREIQGTIDNVLSGDGSVDSLLTKSISFITDEDIPKKLWTRRISTCSDAIQNCAPTTRLCGRGASLRREGPAPR